MIIKVASAARRGMNGVFVAAALPITLPLVVIAERIRRGAGRSVAVVATRVTGRLCGISFEIQRREVLDAETSYVFVPNHASPVDIPAMLLAVPDAVFLAADELFRVPVLGSAMRALGAMPVDRTRSGAAQRRLMRETGWTREGSVVVFAEGGIPPAGRSSRFKSGAFVMAIQAGRAVVPVTISGSAAVLPRGHRIWARPGVISVRLHEPIDTAHMSLADRKPLRDLTERVVRGAGKVLG